MEDGLIDRHEFGHWLMHNLDIDLLMQWSRSNVYCILDQPPAQGAGWWGELDAPRCTVFMGTDYWHRVYPTLPKDERPKLARPQNAGGRMFWWNGHDRNISATDLQIVHWSACCPVHRLRLQVLN